MSATTWRQPAAASFAPSVSFPQVSRLITSDLDTLYAKLARIEAAIAAEPRHRRRRKLINERRILLDQIEEREVEHMRLEKVAVDEEMVF